MEEQFFNFSKRERIGILVLVVLIASVSFLNYSFEKKVDESDQVDLAFVEAVEHVNLSEKKRIAQKNKFSTRPKTVDKYPVKKQYSKKKDPNKNNVEKKFKLTEQKPKEITPFEFNPNTVAKQDLLSMGLPTKVVNILSNYQKKGGLFFSKEDFKKIYGVTDELYATLESFIIIPERKKLAKKVSQEKKIIKKIDMNLADGPAWDKLYGINPYLSNKILDYKDLLGGFVAKEQLLEIQQIPDSVYQIVKNYIQVESEIEKRNLNEVGFKALKSHPYIGKKLAGRIITHLDRNGNFKNFEAFQKILKITPKELDNISAYFVIQ